jgi:hypothetical protein
MDRFESARRELKEHIKNCLNTKQTKVGSRVTLRFDVVNSPALSPEQKELVMSRLGNRIGKMVYFVSFRSRPTARQKIGSSGKRVPARRERTSSVRCELALWGAF